MKRTAKTTQPSVSWTAGPFNCIVFVPELAGPRGAHQGWDSSRLAYRIEHPVTMWEDSLSFRVNHAGFEEAEEELKKAASRMQCFVGSPSEREILISFQNAIRKMINPPSVPHVAECRLIEEIANACEV